MCLLDFLKEFEFKPFQGYQEVQIIFCQIAVVSSTLIIGTQDSLYSEKFNQTESTICQVSLTKADFRPFTHMPYPCSHFYFDIKFGDRFYSKENRPGSPLLF